VLDVQSFELASSRMCQNPLVAWSFVKIKKHSAGEKRGWCGPMAATYW